MTYIRTTLLAAILVSIATSLFAQTEDPESPTILSSEAPTLRFENLSLEDGMAQFSAENVIQDSLGYMWIATQGGLHRYNGYEFEVYTSTPFDTTTISDNITYALEEGSNGDIWVGSDMLNRFDRKTRTFTRFRHDPDDSTTIIGNIHFDIYEASNGDVWISSPTNGVSRLPAGETNTFENYYYKPGEPNSLSSDLVFRISEDSEGNIWVGSRAGVNRINPEKGGITRFLDDPGNSPEEQAKSFVRDQYHPPGEPNMVWLTTVSGLIKLNTNTGETTLFAPSEDQLEGNTYPDFSDLEPDPENPDVFWVTGYESGLVRFDSRTSKFTFYRNDPGDPNSIVNNTSTNITSDRSGRLWMGHLTDGITQFTPSSASFFHIRHDPQNPQSLSPGIVNSIYEGADQTLWVGTGIAPDGYLNKVNLTSGETLRYIHDPNDPQTIPRTGVRYISEDQSGMLWVGTYRGLSRFNPETGLATSFTKEPLEQFLPENEISWITPSKEYENEVWLAVYNGLRRVNGDTGETNKVRIEAGDVVNPYVRTLFYDTENRLWAGTDAGLILIDPYNGDHKVYRYNPADTTGINSNVISTIAQRENEPGVLWLGSPNGGLNRFDISTGKASHITKEDGLADNVIYGILIDDRGTLWMSTNQGISNYDPDDGSIRNYGLEDGLIQLEYSQNAFEKGANGILYFGHKDGITAFNPENLRTNTIPPQVVISDFRLFNESVLPGPDAPFDEQIEKETEITIAYDQTEVAFEYVGLHYSNPAKNQYKYQLEGFDENWVDAGTRRMASYTNLDPGEYTFRVQASNADGVWNTEGATLTLTVLPPWYRTVWAYGLFALLLAGFIYGGDRFQRRRLAMKEEERAALREAELRAEEENKRRSDTEQLSKIGRTITSTLSVDEIIQTTYENVNELMDAEVFGVGILNREKNRLEFPATTEKGKILKPYSHNLDDDSWLSAWCFNNQDKIVIGDFEKEYGNYINKIVDPIRGENPESIIYLPLVHKGEAIGVLTTQSFEKNAYSEYHVTLLQNLANYAAIALDNASAYRRLNKTLEDLKAVQTQLVQQEKLASLGQLTAGIAHEIKNPLNFVNNFSELSLELVEEIRDEVRRMTGDGGPEDSPLSRGDGIAEGVGRGVSDGASNTEFDPDLTLEILDDIEMNLKKIHEHGSRADSIVKSMLQHSRGGSGQMEPTPLNPLIKEYVNLSFHGMRAGKEPINVDIDLQLDESVGEVPLIAEDFSRVIVNLVNNAFDAMREKAKGKSEKGHSPLQGSGGAERSRGVSTELNYHPKLTVRTTLNNGKVTIDIEDNGPGIPDEMKDKILQPFFTTKKGTDGTGLGLSITNDIIKAHGGSLAIKTEGEGTCFIINLNRTNI